MKFIILICLTLILALSAAAQVTPQEAILEMKRGINIGNTLEPPLEGDWNNGPLQEYYFDDYKAEGFTAVRIPVRWDKHTSNSAPFSVNEPWMSRVEQVVDWGLERNFYIILNAHHEDWLKTNYSNPIYRARFDSIWSQIAHRFKDKSEKLLFEIINEPNGMTRSEVDDLNQRVLSIIRKTNQTRIVIYSGNEYSGASAMMAAQIPDINDNYLMAYYHSYDPWNFAGEGNGVWGTTADRNAIAAQFQSVYQWSIINNIPVMISEFGAVKLCDFNSRMYHYSTYVEESLAKNIAFQVWDDGGDFGIYERDSRTWSEVKDILTKTQTYGATRLRLLKTSDSSLVLIWQNRNSDGDGITIQRKVNGGEFIDYSNVESNSIQFIDTGLQTGKTYYYRLVSRFSDKDDSYSYPVRIYLPPTERSTFHDEPLSIPGTIECEDFDIGGEGLTYHDSEPSNIPGAYRPEEGVDIETRPGGFQISYVESGEWIEYTVDVEESGNYFVTAYLASMEGGGKLSIQVGNSQSEIITVPKTSSWTNQLPALFNINLSAGEQIMRLNIISAQPFNIDKLVFTLQNTSSVESSESLVKLNVYPNPVSQNLNIEMNNFNGIPEIEIFNILGERVRKFNLNNSVIKINVADFSKGFYFLRVITMNKVIAIKKFVVN